MNRRFCNDVSCIALILSSAWAVEQSAASEGHGTLHEMDDMKKQITAGESRSLSDIQACVAELNAADANGDFLLKNEEYLDFIATRSEGLVNPTTFGELPLAFINNYFFAACLCQPLYGGDGSCCLGENASIELDFDAHPLVESSTESFCRNIDSALAGVERPTISPIEVSAEPSVSPTKITPMPTPEALVCMSFQYGIFNSAGIGADDIFNEVGNTLKTGLLIATATIVSEFLNENYPRDGLTTRRRTALLPSTELLSPEGESSSAKSRRLASYTSEFPVKIDAIVDNPLCNEPKSTCSIVLSQVCVLLEEGDNEEEVKEALLGRLNDAINNSDDFQEAIPEENRLPE